MSKLYVDFCELYPFPFLHDEDTERERVERALSVGCKPEDSGSYTSIEADEETLRKLQDKYNEVMSFVRAFNTSDNECDVPGVGRVIIKTRCS